MTSRRQVVFSVAGFATLGVSPLQSFARQMPFNGTTAPDGLSREILRNPITRLDQSRQTGADVLSAIRLQTPRVIEQNFARLPNSRIDRLLHSLTEDELRLLAAVYAHSSTAIGHQPRLYDLLAMRAKVESLAHASRYFGYAPLYEAVVRNSPGKAVGFQRAGDPLSLPPNPSAGIPLPALGGSRTGSAEGRDGRVVTAGPNMLDYTLYEIYLSFRTAPVGSLSAPAAAFEAFNYAVPQLGKAFGYGFAIGTGFSWLLQNYAPEVHFAIGERIHGMVEGLGAAWTSLSTFAIGTAQQTIANAWPLGSFLSYFPGLADYGVTNEWNIVQTGGGGCGGDPEGCPIQE